MIKKIIIGLIFLVVVLVVLLVLYASTLLQPVSPVVAASETFIVPKGASVTQIGQRLHEENLVKHPLVFRWVVYQKDLGQEIQAGSFELSPSMDPYQIAQTLTEGAEDTWVTLIEGWRAEQIADHLEKQDLISYSKEDFLRLVEENDAEGKLFPDTYLVPKEMETAALYKLLINTYQDKVLEALAEDINQNPRDFEDVLVMASLLEREAKGYQQMRHVAGILWNRVDIGMPLQVDATLQYAKGYDPIQQSWWVTPTRADKEVDSPFNTYQNPGLPPKPISNPGQEAVKAALNPMEVDDLYYLHTPDGKMFYAETLEGHNANINSYLR